MLLCAASCCAAAGAEPQGHTPAECCSLCKATDLCNAWVFCNKKVRTPLQLRLLDSNAIR
jgi:hypothetical protein